MARARGNDSKRAPIRGGKGSPWANARSKASSKRQTERSSDSRADTRSDSQRKPRASSGEGGRSRRTERSSADERTKNVSRQGPGQVKVQKVQKAQKNNLPTSR